MCGCLSHAPTGDLAHNPGMCPDWELNQRPFGSHAVAQSTEPHQPGMFGSFLMMLPQMAGLELKEYSKKLAKLY